MKYSHYKEMCYPIYQQPTSQEITELLGSGWDTLRGMIIENELWVASGYGNTHQSIVDMARTYKEKTRMSTEGVFIIYCLKGIPYIHCDEFLKPDKIIEDTEYWRIERAIELYNEPEMKGFLRRVKDFCEAKMAINKGDKT